MYRLETNGVWRRQARYKKSQAPDEIGEQRPCSVEHQTSARVEKFAQ
jgi:hypothetical protein